MSLAVAVAVVAVVAARSGHHSILISMAKSRRSKQTAPESPPLTLPPTPPSPSPRVVRRIWQTKHAEKAKEKK